MKIAVKDASIMVDLANGGLLSAWFDLGIATLTTDLVLAEIRETAQRSIVEACVRRGQLAVRNCDAVALAALAAASMAYGISLADTSALHLAQQEKATLLTGDGRLRKIALAEHTEVHGLLWVMDLLIERGGITRPAAAAALRKITTAGSFLPAAECSERLRKWNA